MANKIRAKKQLELEGDNHDIQPRHKREIYFFDYFSKWLDGYKNKDKRLVEACYNHFISFLDTESIDKKITTRQVDKALAEKFREYLGDNLNGETPHNYFGKFIKLCHEATEQNIFRVNPCRGIKNKRPEGLKKDILTINEIKALRATNCSNDEVKSAFLFSLNTGLRWVDVKGLKWQNIDGDIIRLIQSKTNREVVVFMNDNAMSILPKSENMDE